MKTLYGLTEAQMWEVHRACREENWKCLIEMLAEDLEDCDGYTEEDLEEMVDDALCMIDDSERLSNLENDIAFQAIGNWLDERSEEA